MQYNLDEIAGILGQPVAGSDNRIISVLLTDSRSVTYPEKTLFFAIPTEGNDGHNYIPDLYKCGVRAFVVNRIPEEMTGKSDAAFFKVDDTVAALQRIAGRKGNIGGEVVGITGSRGKTTLKEWIFQLMEPLAEIERSPRSYNSRIGVPLSLWEMEKTTQLSLIEAGISRKGEMAPLRDIIDPDTVIFTNINDETHSSGFSSIREKAAEKALLAGGGRVKTLLFSADSKLVVEALKPYCEGKRIMSWSLCGNPDAAVALRILSREAGRCVMGFSHDGTEGEISFPCGCDADIENAAAALTFMLAQGISADVIAERFSHLHLIGTRLNVTEGVNGCSVIYDSYTSDFSSLGPALDFMKRRANANQTPVLVLSDLRHESHRGGDLYGDIASLVRVAGIRRFIGIGPQLCARRELFGPEAAFYGSTAEFLENAGASDFSNEIILLKGAPEFSFGRIYEALEARKHETVLEVNLDAVVKNYNWFRRRLPFPTGIVAMVKASGYGAGSFEIARTLQDCGAAYLAVAVIDEGLELRRGGITMPIMVMNPRTVDYRQMIAGRLEPEIYSLEMLADVIKAARKSGIKDYPIHIKLDTGMHRMGFAADELPAVMDMLGSQNEVELRSVFSHLATADCPDMDDYTLRQLQRFEEYTAYMESRARKPFLRHILNSAGIIRFPQYHYDMVRLGIGLYGVRTLPEEIESGLETVSSLRTVIFAIREYESGEAIGYGRRSVLGRRSRIATIPIGYADGMNRKFGCGAISVRVNGKDAPTVGNICMDACMIDVTGIDCKVGDEVEIFGREAEIYRLSDCLETIPYEVLTSVSPRVKRVYFRE